MALLRIAGLKLIYYRSFWLFLAAYAVGLLFLVWFVTQVQTLELSGSELPLGQIIEAPHGFNNISWLVRFGNVMLQLLMVHLVATDFSSGFIKQLSMSGLRRFEVYGVYLLMCAALAVFVGLAQAGVSLMLVESAGEAIGHGFGVAGAMVIQSFYEMVFVLTVVVLFKRPAVAAGWAIGYTLVLESLFGYFLFKAFDLDVREHLPFAYIKELVPGPILPEMVGANLVAEVSTYAGSTVWVLVFVGIALALLKFRDLSA